MEKYQIYVFKKGENNAGSKAPDDIAVITEGIGFKKVTIRESNANNGSVAFMLDRQATFLHDWIACYSKVPHGSTVLFQHPFRRRQLARDTVLRALKKRKDVTFIALMHDIEGLRGYKSTKTLKEYQLMLDISDYIIVHNDAMKEYLINNGITEDRIVVLGIFDYLHDQPTAGKTFEKKIIIAGNLNVYKSAYLLKLKEIEDVPFILYGSNYSQELDGVNQISYGGSFSPNEIITKLNGGLGLVWDGDHIDTCAGTFGDYLRYNNPHKLSMYLSAGLPVVIWSEAAEAEFVMKSGVGIVVDSLYELRDALDHLDEDHYRQMCKNASDVASRLTQGAYTKAAVQECLRRMACTQA